MTKHVVQLLAHAIEEYDQLRLLTSLGYEVFSPGGYENPGKPGVDMRPPLPDVPYYPDLAQACWQRRHDHRDDPTTLPNGRNVIDWAKYDLPDEVLDWADVVIVHHMQHTWIADQWPRLRDSGKRIVWRTVGQSVENDEQGMAPFRAEGLEVVRYSPKERNIPSYIGEDALIRFYKDPAEYTGWYGDIPAVIQFVQHFYQRSCDGEGNLQPVGKQFTNWQFWSEATKGLPSIPMGPGSEVVGGTGGVDPDTQKEMLRRARAYLYTGTQPASYTLGLIEAMMTGVPVVSIGPQWHQVFPYGPELFEGHEIACYPGPSPRDAHDELYRLLKDPAYRQDRSAATRERALDLFDMTKVGKAWREFLG